MSPFLFYFIFFFFIYLFIYLFFLTNDVLYADVSLQFKFNIQSTLVISNSKGLTEILRDIRASTYQSWESEENNKLNNHI